MARQIIVMNTNPVNGGQISVQAAFWFPVTAGQEAPTPGFVSAVKGSNGPNTQELTDLQDGKVIEEINTYEFPDNYSTTNIKAGLVLYYQRRAVYLAAQPFRGQYYGVSYNGTAWSA